MLEAMVCRNRRKRPREAPQSREILQQLDDEMPDEEVLYDLAELFKVFGDSTRIKILYALFQSELCVGGYRPAFADEPIGYLASAAGPQADPAGKIPADGKTVLYSLADSHVTTILNQGTGTH